MDYQYLNGIESIELGVVGVGGGAPSNWVRLEEIEDGSVSIAVNSTAKTRIRVEDNPGVRLTLLGDTDPDALNFGTINLKQKTCLALFGGRIDYATATYYMPGEQKIIRMAVRMTTKLVNGIKDIFTFATVDATAGFNGNFTRAAVVSIRVSADLIPFKDEFDGSLIKCTVQTVDENGDPVQDPLIYTTVQTFAAATTDTDNDVTSTVPATDPDLKFEFIGQTGTIGADTTMTLKIAGASVNVVNFPVDYIGAPFRFTSTAGVAYEGSFQTGTVNLA